MANPPRTPPPVLAPPPSVDDLVATEDVAPTVVVESLSDATGSQSDRDLLTYLASGAEQVAAQRGKQINYVTVSHAPSITLYDPEGNARRVPHNNLAACRKAGMTVMCPFCHGRHSDDSPNQCPQREQLKYTTCPVCRKRIFELRAGSEEPAAQEQSAEDDPLYVAPFESKVAAAAVSREEQLRARLTIHMWTYHPTEAATIYNMTPPPSLPHV